MTQQLPEPWYSVYGERKEAIQNRLRDFASIPTNNYFYELAYCILTPQSSAKNADATIEELTQDKFYELGFDPTSYLRNPAHYIRFHNVKSKRLLKIREMFPGILPLLNDKTNATAVREKILEAINGFGMKEASHFLRNIGFRNLAILDRHILKHLHQLGMIGEIPTNAPTKKRYLEIEQQWLAFADKVKIPLDELDLLFWSMQTGMIRK